MSHTRVSYFADTQVKGGTYYIIVASDQQKYIECLQQTFCCKLKVKVTKPILRPVASYDLNVESIIVDIICRGKKRIAAK